MIRSWNGIFIEKLSRLAHCHTSSPCGVGDFVPRPGVRVFRPEWESQSPTRNED